ncbi:MAG: hypothetical protein WDN46_09805 [Methylocella sp.]
MPRIYLSMAMLGATLAIGGCNASSGAPVAAIPSAPAGPAQPNWPPLPANAACSDNLNRYQTVLTSDVSTGNVNQSVYDQIEADLMRAADACAGGRDSEAMSIIRATKVKHGYHA